MLLPSEGTFSELAVSEYVDLDAQITAEKVDNLFEGEGMVMSRYTFANEEHSHLSASIEYPAAPAPQDPQWQIRAARQSL